MRAIIVAAGTGGHITPGISIANKIKKENPQANILFIGTKNGMENDILKKEGYTVAHIRAEGLKKEFSIAGIKSIFSLLLGIKDAKKIIKEFKPDIVIGTGGYVCYPIFNVATKRKIPTMLHESNSIPGKVVRAMAKKVDTIMVGFEEAKEKIYKAKNVVYTGTPTKMSTYIPMENLKEKLGLRNDLPIVLLTGGSQGAKKLNEVIVEMLAQEDKCTYQLVFVTGDKNYDSIVASLNEKCKNREVLDNVHILSYVYNMEEYMSVADLVIARAGALSLTEICIMGKPSILIPYPYAAENHQVYNAKALEKANASTVILEDEMTAEKMKIALKDLLFNEEKKNAMAQNAKKLAVLNVDDRIYAEIEKLVKK